MTVSQLQEQLGALGAMSGSQLRAEWTRVSKETVPDISAELLSRGIAYHIQERTLGSLTAAARRQIKRMVGQQEQTGTVAAEANADLRPGTRLARDWHGKTHNVLVLDEGYLFEDRKYGSLSQIANAITGTRWSGPRFFGLVKRKTVRMGTRELENA